MTGGVGVFMVLDRMADVARGVAALTTTRVYVGIPAAKTERKDDEELEITNALLGYVHENGAPEHNIPARPWLKPGVASVQNEITGLLRQAGQKALEGKVESITRIYNAVGLVAQNAVKKKITDGPFAALSPRTLAARRARGRTGTKPLIDTGQMRNAVTYVVRDN